MVWGLITLTSYYYINFFFRPLIWLVMSLLLFIVTINQLGKLIKERKALTQLRIAKLGVFELLFILTFFNSITNVFIEKVDWGILKNTRKEIVEQIKEGELKPNTEHNNVICELPFEFPIVSNGGNDVCIYRDAAHNHLTVEFWVSRVFFDSPQTLIIYTDNPATIKEFERKIAEQPNYNWRLEKNWYRI